MRLQFSYISLMILSIILNGVSYHRLRLYRRQHTIRIANWNEKVLGQYNVFIWLWLITFIINSINGVIDMLRKYEAIIRSCLISFTLHNYCILVTLHSSHSSYTKTLVPNSHLAILSALRKHNNYHWTQNCNVCVDM